MGNYMQKGLQDFKKLGEDSRGSVYAFFYGGKEYHLIKSNAGAFRGGDFHSSDSESLLLSGEVEWKLRENNQIRKVRQFANEKIVLPADIPHILEAIKDSWFVEFLDAPGKFTVSYDREMR